MTQLPLLEPNTTLSECASAPRGQQKQRIKRHPSADQLSLFDLSNELTAGAIRAVLSYDPDSGIFTWQRGGTVAGTAANGYIIIWLYGRLHMAHRLAWLLMHGHWPLHEIDHRDGVRHHNALANLRDVPHAINLQNRHTANANNRLGYLGVYQHGHRYEARIRVQSKPLTLGWYDTDEQAHQAVLAARRQYLPGYVETDETTSNKA